MSPSSENGIPILKIGRKGKMRLAFGDGQPFEIDVIGVNAAWSAIDNQFRDDKGQIPREKLAELHSEAWNFVRGLSKQDDLSLAEALEFLRVITEEGEKLKGFFEIKSSAKPSSPERTTAIYSE
jgi:hypothetical protein